MVELTLLTSGVYVRVRWAPVSCEVLCGVLVGVWTGSELGVPWAARMASDYAQPPQALWTPCLIKPSPTHLPLPLPLAKPLITGGLCFVFVFQGD